MLLILLVGFTACEEILLGPQPFFIEDSEHQSMLNIMGILRPDSIQSYSGSFIQLEKSVPVPFEETESREVRGARVELYKMEFGQVVDTIVFEMSYFEEVTRDSAYRSQDFYPAAGETYRVECQFEDLPVLTSETTIPNLPELVDDTIYVHPLLIDFSIKYDSTSCLYDINVFRNNELFFQSRYLREEDEDLTISLSVGADHFLPVDTVEMVIYAYDLQLSDYITTSPSAIWPNTYQPAFSTVDNGYGCFGSLNILRREID